MAKLVEYLGVEGKPVKVIERSASQRASFWPKLLAVAPWIQLEHVKVPGLAASSTKLVGPGKHGSITFVGDIEGQQLIALVETLRALATEQLHWTTSDTASELQTLERDVALDVFVSPLCPFCVTVSAAALRFAAASAAVSVRILRADVVGLPEQVHTVPTVLADDEVVAHGAADEHSLIRQIVVYQRAMSPVSGIVSTRGSRPTPSAVRSTVPVAPEPPVKRRRPRSTAA